MKLIAVSLISLLHFQDSGPWRVVFERDGKLWSIREDGSDCREEPGNVLRRAVASPDGKRLTSVSTKDGDAEIWVSDIDGKNLLKLTDNSAMDSFPDWTPDSKRITFTSNRTGKPQIWIMEADGTNPTRLTDHPNGARESRISPRGDCMSYIEILPARESVKVSTLRMSDLSGRDAKVLIENEQIDDHAWSPKGDQLAVRLGQELRILETATVKTIWSITLADKVPWKVANTHTCGLNWRPDGGAIAYTFRFAKGGCVDHPDGTYLDVLTIVNRKEGRRIYPFKNWESAVFVRWIR